MQIILGAAPFEVGCFPHLLRVNLMREHLGDLENQACELYM
jgi:hypothetical protein